MANSFIQIHQDGTGKKVDNSLLTISGQQVYRQRVEVYSGEDLPVFGPITDEELRASPLVVSGSIDTGLSQGLTDAQLRAANVQVTTNGAFGQILADAWGIPKVSLPYSLFHGLFTFDIPPSQWFMYENGIQVYTSTNIISENSEGVLRTSSTKTSLLMESRVTPRYQPNRGHLYSTALWCPSKTKNGTREWGLKTVENGVFFRLKANGFLYAVLKSGGVETKEELIDTSNVSNFDIEKGNVFDIQYQWRGIGNYHFFINLIEVHAFLNLGELTALSMRDPALPAIMTANRITEDVEIHAGCVDITSENGNDDRLQYSSAYAEVSLNGTNQPLFVIHSPAQINGVTNTRMLELSRITLTCDKKATFKIWSTRSLAAITGATLTAIGGGSFVQCDSPDTVTGAIKATAVNTALMHLITVIPVQAGISRLTDNPFQGRIDFPIVRGDYLVITANVATGTCDAVVEWGEAI